MNNKKSLTKALDSSTTFLNIIPLSFVSCYFFITDVFVKTMKTPNSSPSLRLTLLKLLGLLLCAEGKRNRDTKKSREPSGAPTECLSTLLDCHAPDSVTCCPDVRDRNEEQACEGVEPSGSVFCNALLDVYQFQQTAQARPEQKVHAAAALTALLAVSQTAKNTALQGTYKSHSLSHLSYRVLIHLSIFHHLLTLPLNVQLFPRFWRRLQHPRAES